MQFTPPGKALTKSPTLQAHIDARPLQPKLYFRKIAQEGGLLVPEEAYADPRDIQKQLLRGEKFISRSEHPLEMFFSDILNSEMLDSRFAGLAQKDFNEITTFGQAYDNLYKSKGERRRSLEFTCKIIGVDFPTFLSEVSSTYWKVIEGRKVTVVADSVVPGRYHIFGDGYEASYARVENNRIDRKLSSFTKIFPDVPRIISAYEDARRVFCDGEAHALIVEQVAAPKGVYFLQATPGLDFSPADFRVDWPLRKGEMTVPFVRGRTDSAQYVEQELALDSDKRNLKPGSASSQIGTGGLTNILSRMLSLYISFEVAIHPSIPNGAGHDVISYLFKPKISMMAHDVLQAFTWGRNATSERIVASSKSKSMIEKKAGEICGKDVQLEFPAEHRQKYAFFLAHNGKLEHYSMVKEYGKFYIVKHAPPSETWDEKATIRYVSDGSTAYLSRVD